VNVQGLDVQCTTLRGDTVAFGWEGSLLVNGEAQPLSGYKHYENPFCTAETAAEQVEIRTADYVMRLNFAPRD
jgi:hypothetical protein